MAEITTGAKWAIERLERLWARPDYHQHTTGIGALIGALVDGIPIDLAMTRPPATEHPERLAILHAALCRDAVADLLGPLLHKQDEMQEIRKRIVELDNRTMRSRMIR